MKTILFASIAILTLSSNASAQWDSVSFPNPSNGELQVYTADNSLFAGSYIFGLFTEAASLSYSLDNGTTWNLDTSGLGSANVQSCISIGNDIFIGATTSHESTTNSVDSILSLGGVFLSTNGGQSWISKNTVNDTDGNYEVGEVAANGSTLYRAAYGNGTPVAMGYDGGGIWSSNNLGDTWSPILVNASVGVSDFAVSGNNLVASFYYDTNTLLLPLDTARVTTDNGIHWSHVQGVPDTSTLQHYFTNGKMVYAAGWNGGIFTSTDYGVDWNRSSDPILGTATVNGFTASGSTVFAATEIGVSYSTDAGTTWHNGNDNLSFNYGAQSIAANSAYLFVSRSSSSGVGIWRRPLSNFSAVNESAPHTRTNAWSYPNPCDRYSTIHYSIPRSSHVTIQIFNLLSQTVTIPIAQYIDAGTHDISIPTELLSDGIYSVRITANEYSECVRLCVEH